MFKQLYDDLLSPLGKEYCVYFYILTVVSCATFIVSVVSTAMMLFKGDIKIMHAFPAVMAPGLIYFSNRLFYSMCVR